MPAVTDHAISSEHHRLIIAVIVTELISNMTQAWVSLHETLHLVVRLNMQHVPCTWALYCAFFRISCYSKA